MKYINIDAEFMIKHKLTLEQAAFLSYLRESLSWANDVIIDNVAYKWVSRKKVVSDIPYITEKTDTVYRWFTKMHELGLIVYKKHEGQDLFKLNDVCKGWNSRSDSDGNPTKLGRQSDEDSDGNPTYSNNNNYSNNKYITETYPKLVSFYNELFSRNVKGCSKSRKQYSARVKQGYKLEDLQKAITAMHQDKYHKETDYKYAMLEFITREDKLERFMNISDNARELENMTDETRYWKLIEIIKLKPRNNNRFTYDERKFIIAYQASIDRFPPDERKLVQDTSSLTRSEIDQMQREEGWNN